MNGARAQNRWNFRESTQQVYQLLQDLSKDWALWQRFINDPVFIAQEHGLCVPDNIIVKDSFFKQRPSAKLFSSTLNWEILNDRYLRHSPRPPIKLGAYQYEILPTLSKVKPVARLVVREEDLGTIIQLLEEKQAPFILSPFKDIVESDRNKKGFANLAGQRLPFESADAQGTFMVYVSLDGARAQTALLLEALGADCELGRILGYPECCIEFFGDNFDKSRNMRGDLVSFSIRHTCQPPPYLFYLNNVARYFGVRLIHHFPCSYTCAASIALGKRYLEVLHKSPGLGKTQEFLMCSVIYSDMEGVFLLQESCGLSDGCLAYNPDCIKATNETTRLYHWLRAADRIKALDWHKGQISFDKGNVTVGQADSNVWCLTFTE